LLLFFAFLLLCGSCEKDQITGLDLTSDGYSDDFTYKLSISGTNALLRCPLGELPGDLTINGRTYGEQDWWNNFQIDAYVYYQYQNIYGEFTAPKDTTDYVLTKSGVSYSGRIIRPGAPIMSMPDFDPDEDYSFSWTASPRPMFFRLDLYYLGYKPDECIQIEGGKRNYKVTRSHWAGSSYPIFHVVMESISYNTHGKNLLAIQSSGTVGNWVLPPE